MSTFDRLDVYYDDEPRSAALNMAMDEALLETSSTPVVRFYGWSRPALSFGYFGKFEEAAEIGAGRELVRRWTGGGIVLHGTDLTYSIVVPARNYPPLPPSRDFYSNVHAAIRDVLSEEGFNAILANSGSPKISEACFSNTARADVLIEGKKIAGAAQRRTRKGLLQQGSIQHPALPNSFAAKLVRKLCSFARGLNPPQKLIDFAQGVVRTKYETQEWLHRR